MFTASDYVRFVIHTITHDVPDNQFNAGESQRQRRLGMLLVTDGPIHTVWVWYTRLRYNWFTIGWHCWRNGHDYTEQFIGRSPRREFYSDAPGTIKSRETGQWETHYIRVCSYCGNFRGVRRK